MIVSLTSKEKQNREEKGLGIEIPKLIENLIKNNRKIDYS